MAPIPGSVRVTGFIAPSDSTDTYATQDEFYDRGGWRTVADITARNAITADRRKDGMIVRVRDAGGGIEKFYTLTGGLADINWVEQVFSGGGGAVTFNEPAADVTAGTQAVFDSATVGETVAFGDLLYQKSDGKWWLADADQASTMPGLRMALEAKSADQTCSMLVAGRVRNDAWNWTVGGLIYASTTSGALTQTQPSGAGDQVQVVGVAYHADKMILQPSPVLVEVAWCRQPLKSAV